MYRVVLRIWIYHCLLSVASVLFVHTIKETELDIWLIQIDIFHFAETIYKHENRESAHIQTMFKISRRIFSMCTRFSDVERKRVRYTSKLAVNKSSVGKSKLRSENHSHHKHMHTVYAHNIPEQSQHVT